MEVMPAEPFRLQQSIGFRCAIYGGQSKNPAEWPGRGPETRNHSGRGDAAEGHFNSLARARFHPRVRIYLVGGRKHLIEVVADYGVAFTRNVFERRPIEDVD